MTNHRPSGWQQSEGIFMLSYRLLIFHTEHMHNSNSYLYICIHISSSYDIVISDQAEIDLGGILEYIAFELQAPENASGQLDRLEACIMDLDHMPKRYR